MLADGVLEAMTAAEGALATAQSAASRALAGHVRVQAAGAAAASVPPAAPSLPAIPQTVTAPEERVRKAAPVDPLHVERPTTVERTSYSTVSDAGGHAAAPMIPAPIAPDAARVSFAAFAPTHPALVLEAATSHPGSVDAAPSALRDDGLAFAPDAAASTAPVANAATSPQRSRSLAPPTAQASQSGPTGGDVFLDGTRVGTWLADHMAREVGRPQMGGTGFDPRLTPAWPGTLQGG